MTALQRFFAHRPKLLFVRMVVWFVPLMTLALVVWIIDLVVHFPRHLWIYGLRDWPLSAGRSWNSVKLPIRVMGLVVKRAKNR